MRLLMVAPYATPTNVRRELLLAARTQGHDVFVAAPAPAAEMQPGLAEIGVGYLHWPVARATLAPLGDALAAARLAALIRRTRPDVVLAYQVKAVLLALPASALCRVPRVVVLVNGLGTLFADDGFGAGPAARTARRLYGQVLRLADVVVFHNADDRADLYARGVLRAGADARVVSGSGVDLSAFAPSPEPSGPPRITMVGRLLGAKGVREMVDAARIVRASHPQVAVHLVGPLETAGHPDAIASRELEAWVKEGAIVYDGVLRDVRPALRATTIFALPSYREGLPRTTLEAMAMGLPIVTTDVPGCRDTVEDGISGTLVPPRDAPALARAIGRYLDDPSLRAQHGAAARARAEARFGLAAVNAQMLDALGL